jgi:hypothetical protein
MDWHKELVGMADGMLSWLNETVRVAKATALSISNVETCPATHAWGIKQGRKATTEMRSALLILVSAMSKQ